MRILGYAALAALALSAPASEWSGEGMAFAQNVGLSQTGFQAYLPQLRAQAQAAGVTPATIAAVFSNLQFSQRTVELDRAQPGGTAGSSAIPAFAPYEARHVNANLISRGQQRYRANLGQLRTIGERYGVDPSIMMAIWGHETSYGSVTGDFDLLNSLASLAYEGRRRELFTDEFIATMKMMDRGFSRSELKGSWAGATGYPQFLPSVYIRLGVDGDGDGRANIWSSQLDALASIANYLDNAGWKHNVPWGFKVNVPGSYSRAGTATELTSPRCPRVHERHTKWMTAAEWRQRGIMPQAGVWPVADTELMSLLEPDGPGKTAYLLTINYRTILDYNCSNFYALSVGLLADAVKR
ncbi:lytic murein transglycosylase [Allosphingosinicella vermicomposti]|uniref:lytic murein transglycosylase n=1 Tax=Allosphingosinicella vermicomposti TaxID=614671 RepID=UPI000D0E9C34